MNRNHVEHVAVRVRDLEWHRVFFRDALGMRETEVQGEAERPRQVWVGGMQLTRDSEYAPRPQAEERVWHIGVNVRNIEAADRDVAAYPGVKRFGDDPGQKYWFILPEGLVMELVQRQPDGEQPAV